jgi:ribosomal protein S18 acetylase RimI-like enzyme
MSEASLSALGVEERARWWRDLLGGETPPRVTVIGDHGGLAGFLIPAEPSRDPAAVERTAEIAALNVDPEQWGRGFGGVLVRDALERLRREHWRAVTLWVASGNERAIRFYRSIGFDFDGARGVDDNGVAEQRMTFDLVPFKG